MLKNYALFFFLTTWQVSLWGQFRIATEITSDQSNFSGTCIGIADLNGDLLDDIIFVDKSRTVRVAFQNINQQPFQYKTLFVAPQEIWSLAIADIDNNGRQDIMACYSGGMTIIYNNYSSYDLFAINLGGGFLPQSSNFVDVDGDGLLEVFICDDNGPNALIKLDGGQAEFLDLFDDTNGGTYNGSGNYASLWTDFDLDGDLDLHISKCSAFAAFPTHPERMNRLYVNEGGIFINRAEELGLAFGDQSWATDFGDIDNDGDLDLFVANHGSDNFLYINEDGVYVNKSDILNQENNGSPYQCFFADIDNDTYLDIVVSGSRNYIFYNRDGGASFNRVDGFADIRNAYSCTIGEFNGDGYLDLLASFPESFVVPGLVQDLVLLNEKEGNNYLFVNVFGKESNANGVGARLELYGDWGVQMREVRAGVSYGVATSLSMHFGYGIAEMADSLIVYWPSGTIQKVDSIGANQRLLVYENQCSKTFEAATIDLEKNFLCAADTILINTDGVLIWNDTIMTGQLHITQSGTYSATGVTASCSESFVQAFRIIDHVRDTVVLVDPRAYGCLGDAVSLTAPSGSNYEWNDGSAASVREVDQSFDYNVTFDDLCHDQQKGFVTIEFFEPPTPVAIDDTIAIPGQSHPSAQGASIIWYAEADKSHELGRGDSLNISVRDDSTVYATNLINEDFDRLIIPLFSSNSNNGAYAGSHLNGRQYFTINDPIVLNSVFVKVELAGRRTIQLYDASDALLFENDFDLVVGENRIVIDIRLEPGINYSMTTDTLTNLMTFSDTGPNMLHFDLTEHYPIQRDSRFELTKNNFGNTLYFYFYNWDITSTFTCESEAIPVHIEVLHVTNTREEELALGWKVYPNPTTDLISIFSDDPLEGIGIRIYDMMGVQHMSIVPGSVLSDMDVSALAAGVYHLSLYKDGKSSIPHLFIVHN